MTEALNDKNGQQSKKSADSFISLNNTKFLGHYKIDTHNDCYSIKFTISEKTLKEDGLHFHASHHHHYKPLHFKVKIGAASNTGADYLHAGGFFQENYYNDLQAVSTSSQYTFSTKFDVGTLDPITGFTGIPKQIHFTIYIKY